jgi:ferredoxin
MAELAWPVDLAGAGSRSGQDPPADPAPDPLTVTSIKEFFFPRRQELYEQRPEGIIPPTAAEDKQRLLLFARACDVRALSVLDRVFMGEVQDESYGKARRNTTIVGLHCLQPDRHCFCTSLGGGPFATEGMDVALTPLGGERFAARAFSDKGQTLLASLGGKQAGETDRKAAEQLQKAAEAEIRRSIEVPDLQTMAGRFESSYWTEVSRSCLACGICSYLCPTCHCFDIVDEGYLRLRCWDTCSSDTFTRMATGEDHRKRKSSRYRQRIFHKFSYFKENFDTYSCVGCGRCTRHCPVKIDIVEIVNAVAAARSKKGADR